MLPPFMSNASRFQSVARTWSVVCGLLSAAVAAFAQGNTPSAADGFDPNVDGNVYAVALQPDGKLLVAGQFSLFRPGIGDTVPRNNLARVNPDGTVDPTFDPNVNGAIRALVLQPDGRILIGGDFTALQPGGAPAATTRNHLARLNANGTLDTAFDPNVGGGFTPQVNAILLQADGHIVVGGGFTSVQPNGAATPTTRNRIARLNANGTLDPAFNPNLNNVVFALAQHIDGKILVAGGFTTFQTDGTTRNHIARLNVDGTPDSQFNPNADNRVLTLLVQRDGKILMGGDFVTLQPLGSDSTIQCNHLARLNVDGTLDTDFKGNTSGSVSALSVLPDGRLLVGGSFSTAWSPGSSLAAKRYLACFTSDGAVDLSFDSGVNNVVDALAVQADGQVIIGGYFTGVTPRGSATSIVRNRLARINLDGQLDATLNLDSTGGRPLASAVQPDGKILIGGSFTSIGGVTHNRMARLNADGSVDTTFNPDFDDSVFTILLQPDGKILVGGQFTTIGGESRNHFARLNPSGTIDSEFNPNASGPVGCIALQPDGKILIGGTFTSLHPLNLTTPPSINRFYIARLNADGTLDNGFDPDADNTVAAIAVQKDGKILIGGTFTTLNPNNTFTTDPATGVVTFTSDHSVSVSRFARLNADGTLDTTYNVSADDQIGSIIIQPDNKVLIAGLFSQLRTNGSNALATRYRVARLNADGSLDDSFDPKANAPVASMVLQPDGKILLGGPFTTLTPNGAADYTLRKYAARINADGTVDPAFNLDLNEQLGNRVDSFALQADGKILIAGTFTSLQPVGSATRVARNHFARLTAAGGLDTGFQPGVGGSSGGQVKALAVQTDGKIVAAGSFTDLGGATTSNVARFYPTGAPDTTFTPTLTVDGPINAVLLRPDAATTVPQGHGFAWLNADGSVQSGFSPALAARVSGVVDAIARQPDGNVLVGGTFTTPTTSLGIDLVRYTPAGVLDPSFAPGPNGAVNAIVVQPDGKILIAGAFTAVGSVTRDYVARLNADGSLDMAFDPNANARINSIILQSDGKIVVAGAFTSLNPNSSTTTTTTTSTATPAPADSTTTTTNANGGTTTTTISTVGGVTTTTVVSISAAPTPRNYVARLNSDGTLDTKYDPNLGGTVSSMVMQADGKIVIGGAFAQLAPNGATTGTVRNHIARLNTDGTVDTGYDPNLSDIVTALALDASGRVLVGGSFTTVQPNGAAASTSRTYLARLNTDGTLDAAFDPNPNLPPSAIAVQSDGRILIGGAFTAVKPNGATIATTRNRIARLGADGSVDLTFNPDANDTVNVIAVQSDGSIVAGGFFTTLQPNVALLIGGAFNNVGGVALPNLAVLNDDGTVGGAFHPNPNGAVNALLAQPDGRTVVAGAFTSFAGVTRNRLARLKLDRTLDPAFDPNANGPVAALALQPDGRIVVGGTFTTVGGQARTALARLNADGTLDASFSSATFTGVTGLVLQPDGRLLVVGTAGGAPGRLLRLNADGSTDTTFNKDAVFASTGGGVSEVVNAVLLQTDGRIVVASVTNPAGSVSLARCNSNGTTDPSFNPGTNGAVTALALQPDGRLIIAGSFSSIGGLQRGGLARLAISTPVAQTLAATPTTVQWTRTGGGPTLSGVTFEQSTDTETWIPLGSATRASGTTMWQLSGLSLPASGPFYIRARGIVPMASGSSSGVIENVRQFNFSALAGIGTQGGSGALDGESLAVALSTGTLGGPNGASYASSTPAAKVTGAGTEVGSDIAHPNGNIYDQVLLQGTSATITADPGQVTRISFVDLTQDIVQVEFSGAGALSIYLDNPSGPATAANYNQPGVTYMKGHAGLVITGADETTNVSVFSVGKITAVNQGLFRSDVTYDGMADIAYLAIMTTDGKFGGVRTANASYFATSGITGICAPGVQFTGPVYVGDVTAYDAASPMLLLGSATDTEITGGDLWQANSKAVQVSGISQLKFVDGTTSQGAVLPAQTDRSTLQQNGADVTAQVVVNPNK